MAAIRGAEGKLVHILGGGQWQLYTVKIAKELGYRVLVTDMYEERPAYALADAYEVVDIANMEGTLRVAERYGIDGIICDTTDVGVPTMAYVAEKLGLPGIGFETALNFTDKVRMREMTGAAGVPNPPFRRCTCLEELHGAAGEMGLPLVIKPVDSQSSRGVRVLRSSEELDQAFDEAVGFGRQAAVIAEGFLCGTEATVESLCIDGDVFVVGISDKGHFAHRPEVANRLSYPADLPTSVMDRIRAANTLAVTSLGMRTGITHAEFIVVGSEPFLVEIAARGGGSHVYSHIVPYLAGIPVPRLYLEFLLGGSLTQWPEGGSRAANLAFFDFPAGRVTSIRGEEEARALRGVEILLLEFGVGDVLSLPDDDRSRPGHVVVFGKTREEVLDLTARVFKTVEVIVA